MPFRGLLPPKKKPLTAYGKKKVALLLFFCILGAGILGSILVLKKPESRVVEITRDGEVLYRLDLRTAEDQTFEIDYGKAATQ